MKILSTLIYRDRAGNRRLRDYVKITLGILFLAASVFAVGLFNRNQMVSQVMATPRPLETNLISTVTSQPTETTFAIEDCPSDPASWTLSANPIVPTSNLKALAPPCVNDRLERTVAWVYATTTLGYTRADAATMLGLSLDGLIAENSQILVVTDFNDQPQSVDVTVSADNAQFAEWNIDANGAIGVQMTISGCFYTTSLLGGNTQTWSTYPIICQIFADYRTQYTVSSINGQTYTAESIKNVRRPLWFGYVGNGNWTWLGSGKSWDFDLSQISSSLTPTLTTTDMAEKYSMPMMPLPENWQSAVGQDYVNALLNELNKGQ